ncbi:MAG: aspartate--tRNA(Asn) ligase [Candidatus Aenigmatarchaeota archaeon]
MIKYTNQLRPEEKVVLSGWVHDKRDLGGIKFIILRDREGIVQITASKAKTSKKVLEVCDELKQEDVIAVKGKVVRNKEAPGGLEVIPSEIKIISKSATPLPLDPRGVTPANLDTRLNWRVIDLRRPETIAIFKIQAKVVEGMEEYLRKNGYIQVFTPCLIGGTSESGSEVFPVVYFNMHAFLRQDPQLHRQLLIAAGFDKIYDLGPNWRAEPSHTTRHLCEHRGCAVEFAFMKDESDMMRVEEELIISTIKKVVKECEEELELLGKELKLPKKPFPELRFPGIYKILEEFGKKIPFGEDYDRESENLLAEYVKKKYKSDFFFVNRFPFKVKPFYVMRVDEEPQWARSVDLVYKGLELSSGGQREHRYEKIIQQIKEKGINPETMKWFTEPFKYGVPPHGGFCIGIERFTMQLLDLPNIREATLFPRDPKRLLP